MAPPCAMTDTGELQTHPFSLPLLKGLFEGRPLPGVGVAPEGPRDAVAKGPR